MNKTEHRSIQESLAAAQEKLTRNFEEAIDSTRNANRYPEPMRLTAAIIRNHCIREMRKLGITDTSWPTIIQANEWNMAKEMLGLNQQAAEALLPRIGANYPEYKKGWSGKEEQALVLEELMALIPEKIQLIAKTKDWEIFTEGDVKNAREKIRTQLKLENHPY